MISSATSTELVDPNDIWYMMLRKEMACASLLKNVAPRREEFLRLSEKEQEQRLDWGIEQEDNLLLLDPLDIAIFDDQWIGYLEKVRNSDAQIQIGRYARQFFLGEKKGTFYILHASSRDIVPVVICVFVFFGDGTAKLEAIWRSVWGGMNGKVHKYPGQAFDVVRSVLSQHPEVTKVYVDAETQGSEIMYAQQKIALRESERPERGRYWFAANEAAESAYKRKKIQYCVECGERARYRCVETNMVYCSEECAR